MMTRKELDRLYEALWRGSEEAFIFLLEYFMPFSKYGFTLVNILREFGRWLPPLVYRSRFVELRVIQDLEQYQGLGGVQFEYERIRKKEEEPKGCKKSIMTDIKRNKWLHYFLSDTPLQDTQFYPALLPVEVAFRAKLEEDKNLKALACATMASSRLMPWRSKRFVGSIMENVSFVCSDLKIRLSETCWLNMRMNIIGCAILLRYSKNGRSGRKSTETSPLGRLTCKQEVVL